MRNILSLLLLAFVVIFSAYYYVQQTNQIETSKKVVKKPKPTPQSPAEKTVHFYDQYLAKAIKNEAAPAAALAIVKDGKILLEKGYGYRNVDLKLTADKHTVFRLASVSKGFAGILAGQLVEDEVINWSDPIADYLPEGSLPENDFDTPITVGHVLSNSSGFPHHTYSNLLNLGSSFEEIIPMLSKLKLHATPGKYFAYQNVVFNLATPVMEKKTKKNFAQLVRENIFTPIGMHRASVGFTPVLTQINFAHPHIHGESGWNIRDGKKNYYEVPAAAGVNASATDMSQWLLALLGHKSDVLSDQVREEVLSAAIPTAKARYRSWNGLEKAAYGMGWRVFEYKENQIIYHGGFVRGYRAEIFFWPEEDFGMALLTNGSNEFSNHAVPDVIDYYLNEKSLSF